MVGSGNDSIAVGLEPVLRTRNADNAGAESAIREKWGYVKKVVDRLSIWRDVDVFNCVASGKYNDFNTAKLHLDLEAVVMLH